MLRSTFYRILFLHVLLPLPANSKGGQDKSTSLAADVVVYGDASVGVPAAVQAARMGKSVFLVSQYGHLGGLTSSGLGYTNIGNRKLLGGISRELVILDGGKEFEPSGKPSGGKP